MRRDASAILSAHRMDPGRKELYVEGPRDVVFLRWAFADGIARNARLIHSDFLDIPDADGGARGRLIAFALQVRADMANIRVFVDADYDRVLGVRLPGNVDITDPRDLEGYLLNVPCIEKILRLGLHREDLDPAALLVAILANGRRLGLLRLASRIFGWDLPFQRTPIYGYVRVNGVSIELRYEALVQTLLQNAGRRLRERVTLEAQVSETERRFEGVGDLELTHGKDALQMLACVCQECGLRREAAEPMMWTSFERGLVPNWPALVRVSQFLGAA